MRAGLHEMTAIRNGSAAGQRRIAARARRRVIAIFAAAFVIPLSWREPAAERPGDEPRHGEFQALLLSSVLGMVLLAQAQNLISFFVSLELLSVPLYVLCGSAVRQPRSLESGLKYLIVGSLGSATLLYGLAFIYGGSGSTDFTGIRDAVGSGLTDDPLILIGIALAATGLAFKISIAPFHQWTPDVYQGAPTPVTAFMAVATKAAAFCVFVRFFEVALGPAVDNWQPALAVLAAVSIVVGNIGALGQNSLKRLLGYSGIAQAGYMLVGLVAASALGHQRAGLLPGRLRADEPGGVRGDRGSRARDRLRRRHRGLPGPRRDRPALAWPLTISMLGLAGLPATAGFMGKLYLIEAAVDADYTWLGVAIAIGTMISLAYYLRVVAAVWMRPAAEPRAPEAARPCRRWRAARRRPTSTRSRRRPRGDAGRRRAPTGRDPGPRRDRRRARRSSSASSPRRWSTGPRTRAGPGAVSPRRSAETARLRSGGPAPNISPRRPATREVALDHERALEQQLGRERLAARPCGRSRERSPAS